MIQNDAWYKIWIHDKIE